MGAECNRSLGGFRNHTQKHTHAHALHPSSPSSLWLHNVAHFNVPRPIRLTAVAELQLYWPILGECQWWEYLSSEFWVSLCKFCDFSNPDEMVQPMLQVAVSRSDSFRGKQWPVYDWMNKMLGRFFIHSLHHLRCTKLQHSFDDAFTADWLDYVDLYQERKKKRNIFSKNVKQTHCAQRLTLSFLK